MVFKSCGAESQIRSILLTYRGNGVQQDYVEALRLYAMSASQDNPYADYELAKMYRDGVGTAVYPELSTLHFRLGQMFYNLSFPDAAGAH